MYVCVLGWSLLCVRSEDVFFGSYRFAVFFGTGVLVFIGFLGIDILFKVEENRSWKRFWFFGEVGGLGVVFGVFIGWFRV